jgi:hypothetical protein
VVGDQITAELQTFDLDALDDPLGMYLKEISAV